MRSEVRVPFLLHTPRLTLRRPVQADAEMIFRRYASDPRVTRFMAWPTHESVAQTEAWLAYAEAEWGRWPANALLIIHREDGRLLGATGLDFETATRAETGYVLAHDAWGQGFATEALLAMVELARSLAVAELVAGVHPKHGGSIRVLEKGGFELREHQVGSGSFPNLEADLSRDRLVYGRAP